MFRHPAQAVVSYSSGLPADKTVRTNSTGGYTILMDHPVLMQAYSNAGITVTNCCLPYVVILYRFADPSGGAVHRVLLQQHAVRLRRDAAHQPEAQAALPRRAALRLQAGHALLRTSRREFDLSGSCRSMMLFFNK